MKTLVILSTLFFSMSYAQESAPANKTLKKCQLSKLVDDQVFEEGLSMDEYPDLRISLKNGILMIQVGNFYFGNDAEFIITSKKNADTTTYEINSIKTDYYSYLLTVTKKSAKISISDPHQRDHLFARFSCQ